MYRDRHSISSASLVTLLVTVIIIAIGGYAAFSISNNGTTTSITCSESTATFNVLQNGTSQELSYPIPSEPCLHTIVLSGFSLTIDEGSGDLNGNVSVNSHSPLITILVYVDGKYELFNDFSGKGSSPSTMLYFAPLNNSTVPLIAGNTYSIEFVAIFRDGTATTATTSVVASS